MDNNGARFLSVLSVSPCLARVRATERCVCVCCVVCGESVVRETPC